MTTEPLPAASSMPEIPSLRDILHILSRHRRLMFGVLLGSMIVCCVLIALKPQTYRASATLVIDNRSLNLGEDFKDIANPDQFTDTTVQTEVNVLTSRSLAAQTVQAAGLVNDREFGGDKKNMDAAINAFIKHLTVTPQGTSRVIEVAFKAKNPEIAAKAVNAHIDSYLDAQIDFKKRNVQNLSKWFQAKVTDLKADVVRKAQAVEQYRAAHNLAVGKDDEELVYQQISDTASQLTPVQVHKYDVQSRLQAMDLASRSSHGATTEVSDSPVIQNLKSQAATLGQQVQSLSAQYGENHPKLIAARQSLAQVNSAIAKETSNIQKSLSSEASSSAQQESLLKGRLDNLKKEGNDLRTQLVTLNSLQVEEDASQKLLDSFLANYENVQSQVGFARPDAEIVSPATVPANPAPPGKKILAIGALLFSLFLSLAAVFLAEAMQGGIRNFDDVRKLGAKPLGVLPRASKADLAGSGRSSFREAVKRIFMTGILNSGARVVLVTSAMPKEGRTTLTLGLARYLASHGHKVVAVDADFLRPALSAMTAGSNGPGFADVLTGAAPLASALQRDESGAFVLRAGNSNLASPDVLRSAGVQSLIDQLKAEYEYVLIDSAPLLAHAEAGLLANHADGVIVVAEWIKTADQSIENMFATLKYVAAPILGVVINKVDLGKYKKSTAGSDFLLPRTAGI